MLSKSNTEATPRHNKTRGTPTTTTLHNLSNHNPYGDEISLLPTLSRISLYNFTNPLKNSAMIRHLSAKLKTHHMT